jgi:SAM-dependent methyltransferase
LSEGVRTWHHGLVARWWAEFNTQGPEIAFFRTFVERFGEPVLDVACGTGRLLVPYLAAGFDIDGCDASQEMLGFCRQRATAEGLSPRLFQQATHELQLPRSYKTIVYCGGFALGVSRSQDQEGLNRLFAHLESPGALVLDHEVFYEWPYWSKQGRAKLPLPWPESGDRKRTANGDELELQGRLLAFDPLDQSATRQIRATLWRHGNIVQQEDFILLERLYFRNEVVSMLATAGFRDISVLSGYSHEPASPDSDLLVYVATK